MPWAWLPLPFVRAGHAEGWVHPLVRGSVPRGGGSGGEVVSIGSLPVSVPDRGPEPMAMAVPPLRSVTACRAEVSGLPLVPGTWLPLPCVTAGRADGRVLPLVPGPVCRCPESQLAVQWEGISHVYQASRCFCPVSSWPCSREGDPSGATGLAATAPVSQLAVQRLGSSHWCQGPGCHCPASYLATQQGAPSAARGLAAAALCQSWPCRLEGAPTGASGLAATALCHSWPCRVQGAPTVARGLAAAALCHSWPCRGEGAPTGAMGLAAAALCHSRSCRREGSLTGAMGLPAADLFHSARVQLRQGSGVPTFFRESAEMEWQL